MKKAEEITTFLIEVGDQELIAIFPFSKDQYIPLVAPSREKGLVAKMRECAAVINQHFGVKIVMRRYKHTGDDEVITPNQVKP